MKTIKAWAILEDGELCNYGNEIAISLKRPFRPSGTAYKIVPVEIREIVRKPKKGKSK